MAQLLREAAEDTVRHAERGDEDPLGDLVGVIRDAPSDLAERHDEYLSRPSRPRR